MSFGVGVGDVIVVTKSAWTLYRNCKNSGPEFSRIADELNNIYTILQDIKETLEHDSTGMSRSRAERLKKYIDSATELFNELSKELNKYGDLDTRSQKKWDVLRWGLKDLADIKMRLISLNTNLNAFAHTITQ